MQPPAPQTRREAREAREADATSILTAPAAPRSGGGDGPDRPRQKKPRRLLWLKILLPLLVFVGIPVAGAGFVWLNYEDQVRSVLGWELPNDYETTGNGQEIVVEVQSGDLGSDIAATLEAAGVTMTFDAFYDLLLEQPTEVIFEPGNFALEGEMSAQSALDALLDPANKLTDRLLLREGITLPNALEIISETTSIPLEEVQAAAADPTSYGAPANAPSLEGYLFPATYELSGTEDARTIIQTLVSEMFTRLDAAGVAVEDRHEVLTLAGLIQKEGGPESDFPKVSRVFTNRLEQDMLLQSDATVSYGTGNPSIFTDDDERADASNPYNTYANPGLPIGPISAPGQAAIEAALNPIDGPWLYFVLVNGITGETVFSNSAEEHEAAVEVWQQWVRDNPDWNTGG